MKINELKMANRGAHDPIGNENSSANVAWHLKEIKDKLNMIKGRLRYETDPIEIKRLTKNIAAYDNMRKNLLMKGTLEEASNNDMLIFEFTNEMTNSAITTRINKFVDEFMPLLAPGLPKPEIKIVNSKSNALAVTSWIYRYSPSTGETSTDKNNTILVQKRAAHDDRTLRRIIAHELCHCEDNLVNVAPKILKMGFHAYKKIYKFGRDDHGPEWQEIADRYNQKYGEKFVTKTSDTDYVVEETKPFYALLGKTSDGKIYWQHAKKMTVDALATCCTRQFFSTVWEYKLVKTTNHLLTNGPTISPVKGFFRGGNAEELAKVNKLWDESDDLIPQFPQYAEMMANIKKQADEKVAAKRANYEN